MKILLINTVPLEANGISTFIINSATILSEQGINVTIVAPNNVTSSLKNKLKEKNITVIEILNRMHNPFRYFFNLRRVLKSNKYDVVHVNGNSTTMAIELLAAKIENVKVRAAHSHNTTTEHPYVNKLLRPIFENSVNVRLACNDAAGDWLFGKNQYTVIKNGIFLRKYLFNSLIRKKIRRKYNVKDDECLIGHVGIFNFQKNQKFLIQLLKRLDQKYKLILIGDGPEIVSVKKLVRDRKLENRVIFTGVVNNVPEFLSAIDIFALPSNFEGQPFAVIEATASGLPTIVSTNVSKEINISQKVQFASLSNIQDWINKINKSKINNQVRVENSVKNIELLTQNEYDVEWNIKNKLIPIYYDNVRRENEFR